MSCIYFHPRNVWISCISSLLLTALGSCFCNVQVVYNDRNDPDELGCQRTGWWGLSWGQPRIITVQVIRTPGAPADYNTVYQTGQTNQLLLRAPKINPAHFQPRSGCRLAEESLHCPIHREGCGTGASPLFHLLPVLPLDTRGISPLILQSRSVLYSGHVGCTYVRSLSASHSHKQYLSAENQNRWSGNSKIRFLLDKLNIYHLAHIDLKSTCPFP